MKAKIFTGKWVFSGGLLILLLLLASCRSSQPESPVVYPSVCGDGVCSANEIGSCNIDCDTNIEANPPAISPSNFIEELRNRTKTYTSEERLETLNTANAVVEQDSRIITESFTNYIPVTGFRVASRYNLLSIEENISGVIGVLTTAQLREILRGGTLRANTEAFGPRAAFYEQMLKLRTGKVVFGYDEEQDIISTYLEYKEGEPVWDYLLAVNGGIFKFFEGETIHFLGHDYIIEEVTNSTMTLIGLSTPDTIMFRNKHSIIINGKTINSELVNVTFEKDYLRIIMLADKDIRILPGKSLRQYLNNPEVMLTNRLDISYDGLTQVPVFDIKFEQGTNKYRLSFTTNKNMNYTIPFAYLSPLKPGDENNNLIYKEGAGKNDYVVKKKDYFIISNNKQYNGLINIIRLINVDEEDHLITFEDPALEKFVIYFEGTAGKNASADLIIDRIIHKVYVGANDTLAVDLNGDGKINNDNVPIVTAGNAIIKINNAYHDEINISVITPKEMRENSNKDLEISLLIKNYGILVDKNDLELFLDTDNDVLVGMNNYGALFVLSKNIDHDDQSGEDLLIKQPLVQRFADVIVKAYE